MRGWRHSGFPAYAGEEIPDINDGTHRPLYGAGISSLHPDPAQEPKVRYLARGTVPGHGEEMVSSGHRDYDYDDIGQVDPASETQRPARREVPSWSDIEKRNFLP